MKKLLRDVLLEAFKRFKNSSVVEIIDRKGHEENVKRIPVSDITFIGKGHFNYGKSDTYIPFHRIERVLRNGKVIWERIPRSVSKQNT